MRSSSRRDHARRHYRFVGYAFPFDPANYADRTKVRAALGYDDRPLVVCSVGGTAVGADLLRLCAAAYPHLERRLPGVRMVLVCGPRLDPTSSPHRPASSCAGTCRACTSTSPPATWPSSRAAARRRWS